jgi:type II restriction/modification system DNA methylase subunit YeeA
MWIIDFGSTMGMAEAALYEAPFEHVRKHVAPTRTKLRRENHRKHWWRHGESRPGLRKALVQLRRFIVTSRVAKHRLFAWLHRDCVPDTRLVVFARDDDVGFGVLHSRAHEAWSLATCSWHGVGNDPTYNAESVFETFPFPEGLTPNIPAEKYKDDPRAKAIAAAAARLNELREAWLNPEDLVRREPEVVPGFPDRILPRTEKAATELKKRTLTNLYNTKPQWLVDAHAALDRAVAAAYGWPSDLTDDEILTRLLALNLERAKAQGAQAASVAAADDEPVATAAKPRRKKKHTEE